MNIETAVYSTIDEYQHDQPDEILITAKVLIHLTEDGRIIELLFGKLEGKFACQNDLPDFEKAS